jgi:hypothetical protein
MKKILILIVIWLLTIPLNAQQTQQNRAYLERGKKNIRTGITLTAVGAGVTIAGVVMFTSGLGVPDNPGLPGSKDQHTSTLGIVGYYLMPAGVIIFGVGVPFLISGSIQKGRAQKNLRISLVNFKSPISSASINGIGIKMRF